MTHAEINRRLAVVLGWKEILMCSDGTADGYAPGNTVPVDFTPATDPNHLRAYVDPEIERRGLVDGWINEVWFECKGEWYTLAWFIATTDPAVLAELALRVLEGKP